MSYGNVKSENIPVGATRAGTPESDADEHGLAALRKKRARGGKVEGETPKMRMDRRAKGGRTNGKGVKINVIVAPQGGGSAPGAAMGAPPPAAAPPMPPPRPPMPMAPPQGMPPQMPPGAPMRKDGGRVRRAEGGSAGEGQEDLKATYAASRARDALRNPAQVQADAMAAVEKRQNPDFLNKMGENRGGRVPRQDGGRVPHMTASAANGVGRLEKDKAYGKNAKGAAG